MWTIVGGKDELQLSAGRTALETFERTCDGGKPGKYKLKHGTTLLAEAVVKQDEYAVTWRKPWIFYALGEEGRLDEVRRCAEFLETRQ